jgi:hypothetical protein
MVVIASVQAILPPCECASVGCWPLATGFQSINGGGPVSDLQAELILHITPWEIDTKQYVSLSAAATYQLQVIEQSRSGPLSVAAACTSAQ